VTHDCACSRPIHDTATVCPHCGYLLDAALAEVVAYRGLAYDLDVALAKQARLGSSSTAAPAPVEPQAKGAGTLKPSPLPYHAGASNASTRLRTALSVWANVIAKETDAFAPPAKNEILTLAEIATWLRPRVGWLRYHEAGQEAVDGICDAVSAAWRVVDRPRERLYAGPCDCGADLYARLDAEYVTCRAEAHEDGPLAWPVEERRRWLLRSAEDVLATTTEISRALTRYAQPVTPSAIRGYVARKRLFVKGERMENGRAVPLYRLGDVLAIVAPEQEKVSA
jgi:hypothetical protein